MSGAENPAIQKIINGQLVEEPRRQVAGWSVPATSEQEVAFCLKCVRAPRPVPLRVVLDALAAIGREATWIGDGHLDLIIDHVGCTRKWLEGSIATVNRWLASIHAYVAEFGDLDGQGLSRGRTYLSGGLPTAVILAGDNIILGPSALAHLMIAGGSSAIVKASSAEPLSPFLFARALMKKGVAAPNLVFFDTSSDAERKLIQHLVANTSQSVIYGDDRTVDAVYEGLRLGAAHKAVAFGTGRSGVIVLPDADLGLAARCIVHGASEDRGNRCTSTKKVIAPAGVASELEPLLASEAERLKRGDPHDAATDIGRLDSGARAYAEANLFGCEVFYDRELLIARCSNDHSPLLREELGYPVVGLRYYTPREDPVEVANRLVAGTPGGRATNISVMTQSADAFARTARSTHAYKVQRNAPTTSTDLTMAHHGRHLFVELMRQRTILV